MNRPIQAQRAERRAVAVASFGQPFEATRPTSAALVFRAPAQTSGAFDRFLKRSFDIGCAIAGLTALSPVLLAGAALAKLQSPGPALFKGERVGLNGRRFRMWKFRTMVEDAPNIGAAITTADDARVTRIGRFLRRTKIDELPNLFNVLGGSMSMVGPRPETPNYVALYSANDRRALTVRPGMTGPSQISLPDEENLLARQADPEAFYIDTLIPRKLAIDLSYVRSRTLWKDVGYVVRTAAIILMRLVSKSGSPNG